MICALFNRGSRNQLVFQLETTLVDELGIVSPSGFYEPAEADFLERAADNCVEVD